MWFFSNELKYVVFQTKYPGKTLQDQSGIICTFAEKF